MANIILTQDDHNIQTSTVYTVEVKRHGTNYGESEVSTSNVSSGSTLIHVETPTVTASSNSSGLVKNQVLTASAYSATDGTNTYNSVFPHVSTDWKIYKGEALVEQSLGDTTNLTSYTMTNELDVSSSYTFKVTFHSSQIDSQEGTVSGTTPSVFYTVTTPTLTLNDTDSGTVEYPTITGSAYEALEGSTNINSTLPHTYTNWRCYKVENSGDTLVWSSLNDTTNLTSITLNTALSTSSTYRFEAEYGNASIASDTGSVIGTTPSEFMSAQQKADNTVLANSNFASVFSDVSELPGYTDDGSFKQSEHGRLLYRHSNGYGSVIVFDMFGTTMKLFVADAAYRAAKQFGGYGTDSSLTNFSSNNGTDWYIRGQGSEDSLKKTALGYTFTDAQLQAKWANLSTDLTARKNCDVWMTISDCSGTDRAVGYCRSLTSFDGITNGCDLGNEYECMVLYLESDNLDAMDPTGSSNTGKLLGHTNSHSNGRMCVDNDYLIFSSTEYSSYGVRRVRYDGYCPDHDKLNTYGVVPVREL